MNTFRAALEPVATPALESALNAAGDAAALSVVQCLEEHAAALEPADLSALAYALDVMAGDARSAGRSLER